MFNRRDLARVASASTGAQANWLYSTQDTQDTVLDSTYFGESSPQFRVNDVIQCRLDDRYINLAVLSIDTKFNLVVTQKIDFMTPLDQQGLVNWRGEWQQGIYEKNDQVVDTGWLMIANQTTPERPAPQSDGPPSYSMDTTPLWTEPNNESVVFSGNQYTFTQSGWVNSIRVWVPELTSNTNYRFILIIEAPGDVPETVTIEEPILNADSWTTLSVGTRIILSGTIVTFYIDSLNSGANTNISGGWRYAGPSQGIAPPSQGWTQDNQRTDFIIDKFDLDSADRGTELEGVIPDATISVVQTDNVGRTATYRVRTVTDNGTFMTYETVMLTETGTGVEAGAVTTIDIDVPIALPTNYEELVGNWPTNNPTWATVEGRLAFGDLENIQPGSELNAYGVDILFQPATASSHWNIAALSGDGGAANTNAQIGGLVNQVNQLTGFSFVNQQPPGIGFANQIQVNFGAAQLPLLDAVGTYVAVDRGQKLFTVQLNAERSNNGGQAWLWVYSEVNGIVGSASQVLKLNDDLNRNRIDFTFTVAEQLNIGDEVKFFMYRDDTPPLMDDGCLCAVTNPEPTIPDAPSAFIEVASLVIAP